MSTNEIRYPVHLPEGTVYALVRAASRHDWNDWQTHQHCFEITPRVAITTSPNPDDPGELQLRGRAYKIAVIYRTGLPSEERPFVYDTKSYAGGYRVKASDRQVDFRSPTDARLDQLVLSVCKRLDTEHPQWRDESVLLYWRERISHCAATMRHSWAAYTEARELANEICERIGQPTFPLLPADASPLEG